MAMPIMRVASIKNVVTKRTKANSHLRERTILYEGSASPRELLEGIAIQAQAALKGLESVKPTELPVEELTEEQKRMSIDPKGKSKDTSNATTDENQKLNDFCHRILSTTSAIDRSLRENKGDAFVERLHASLPKVFTSAPTSETVIEAGATEEKARQIYIQWATRTRFQYCDLTLPSSQDCEDQQPHYKFYYNTEARMLANSDIPKRSLAIAKEVCSS